MFSKFVSLALLVTCAQALGEATSFSKFNDQHNNVEHIQSQHAQTYQTAPVQHVAAAYQSPQVYHVQAPQLTAYAAPALSAHSLGGGSYSSSSSGYAQAAPIAYQSGAQKEEEHYAPAKYEFSYGVADHHTGDIHSHKETRDGYLTQGEYSLHEADGTIRTVKYTVDKHSGFNAVVERTGHPKQAAPQYSHY